MCHFLPVLGAILPGAILFDGLADFFYKLNSDKGTLRGLLLYTKEDSSLEKYIKNHFLEFHKLSGNWCKIFILEKPAKLWSLKELSVIEKIKLNFISSIDKSEAYDIARALKIELNQIPCLIFFGEEINSQRLIIPIQQIPLANFPKYFRELFTILETILASASNSTTGSLSGVSAFETFSYRFDEVINYLDKNAQKIASQNQYLYQKQIIFTEKLVMEEKSVSTNYNLQNSQIAGGIVDAETVNSQQIGGGIYNTDNQ